MTDRTKVQLVVVLGLVWVAIILFLVVTAPEPQLVPLKFTSGQVADKGVKATVPIDLLLVRVARVKASQAPRLPSKNIFAPLDRPSFLLTQQVAHERKSVTGKKVPVPVPASLPVVVLPPPPPSPEELAAQLTRQQKEAAAQQARQHLAQYRLLGYLNQDGEEQAFLAKGRQIFIIRKGETIDGHILVSEIHDSGVKLRETATNIEATIQLTKGGGGTAAQQTY